MKWFIILGTAWSEDNRIPGWDGPAPLKGDIVHGEAIDRPTRHYEVCERRWTKEDFAIGDKTIQRPVLMINLREI